jgi:transcriptional regulator with XRE-family HTH domain
MSEETPSEARLRRRIIALRTARGLSPADLARAVGVAKTTVMEWEGTSANPDRRALPKVSNLDRLGKVLGTKWVLIEIPREAPDPVDLDDQQEALIATLFLKLPKLKGDRAADAADLLRLVSERKPK